MLQPLEQQQERLGLSVLLPKQLLRTNPRLQVKHLSFPTILSQGGVSRTGEMAEKAPLQHLSPLPRLSSPQSHEQCHCHTSRNCESPVSAASFTQHPPQDLIDKAKLFGRAAPRASKCPWSRRHSRRCPPFPSLPPAAPGMSSSLFQVEFALGNLPGNQNNLLPVYRRFIGCLVGV